MISGILAELDSLFADFGIAATYSSPAHPLVEDFAVSVLLEVSRYQDESGRLMRDTCEVVLRHAEIAAQGFLEPTARMSNALGGDTLTFPDHNGTPTPWVVVDFSLDNALWVLTLERRTRLEA